MNIPTLSAILDRLTRQSEGILTAHERAMASSDPLTRNLYSSDSDGLDTARARITLLADARRLLERASEAEQHEMAEAIYVAYLWSDIYSSHGQCIMEYGGDNDGFELLHPQIDAAEQRAKSLLMRYLGAPTSEMIVNLYRA